MRAPVDTEQRRPVARSHRRGDRRRGPTQRAGSCRERGEAVTEELDRAVRLQIFGRTAEIGQVPGVQDIADALGQPRALVEESLERLAAGRVIVLSPSATTIWMANPFSAVPTGFRVYANGRTYYG